MERRKIVSVIGSAACFYEECSEEDRFKWEKAYELGRVLVDNNFRVMTGGGRGVMRAVMAGAHSSKNYKEGDTIAIIPSYDHNDSNDFADIVIPTGIDFYRDTIIANSEIVVAVGGGAGTLNELSAAWKLGRLCIAYDNVGGWSEKLAGLALDSKQIYEGVDNKVFPAKCGQDVIDLINNYISKFNKCFKCIGFDSPVWVEKQKSRWIGPVITDKVNRI